MHQIGLPFLNPHCSAAVERAPAEQPEMGESKCDLQTRGLAAEALQAAHPHLMVDPPEIEQGGGDICSELMKQTANVDREVPEVERCATAAEPELWDTRVRETPRAEDQKYNSRAAVSSPIHGCVRANKELCCTFPRHSLI